jgi:tetratricopeptide (TPR) repeat protein
VGYINQFKLIQYIVEGRKLDSKKLLAEVDREKIINALKKNKKGLPRCFNCSNEPIEEENWAKIPINDKKKLWKIYRGLQKSPEKQLPKLLELKKKYPNVPAIYNYIGIAYANCKQNEKYFNTITETLQKFPNYLFGKTALAEYYLNHNEYKQIPKIFDDKFEIYMHFPPTVKIFHVSEIRAFYSVIGNYYARVNKQARALFCYFLLEGIDPSHFSTRKLGDEIILQEIDKLTRIRHKSK